MTGDDLAARRREMVERDLVSRGIADRAVLDAFAEVPRERFVAAADVAAAYDDRPLPIDRGQTISQPYVVALMAQAAALSSASRVLEVGTGSGYAAAVLSRIVARVWSIERHQRLATSAAQRLGSLGYDNVSVHCADGTVGLAEFAPFDAIVVSAAALGVPTALVEQLGDRATLVVPVGRQRRAQRLLRVRRVEGELIEEDLGGVRFVPLVSGDPAR